ncbi:gp112R [Rabbit fibroma virus]|uniref:Gp112R n=1 Tax=Rabbit fibroma virus (strain Kasza) TaxID=10272 RepID=Q9Q8W6_RFVKA|nr:gp112R [Rabbit fibroma virus]AAF17995.1 gp112R [Rabbit fibroma virus]
MLNNRSEIVCAFDVGKKNPARTIMEVRRDKIRILNISKLDWSATNWERVVFKDIASYTYTTVLLEHQPRQSPYSKFVYFIKGLLYGTPTRVKCVSPVMSGGVYRNRKRAFVQVFLYWMSVFGIDPPSHKKLDDVADSFNLAMRYILDKWDVVYSPYVKKM